MFYTSCLYLIRLNNCKQVMPRRCPLPYLVAIHHTNRFIYTQDSKHNKLKNMVLKQVTGLSDQVRNSQLNSKKHYRQLEPSNCSNFILNYVFVIQVLKSHILNYKKFNIDCEYGIELYIHDKLPTRRQETVNKAIVNT